MLAGIYPGQAYLAEIPPSSLFSPQGGVLLPRKRPHVVVDTRARLWIPAPHISAPAAVFTPARLSFTPNLLISPRANVIIDMQASLIMSNVQVQASPELDDSAIMHDDAEIEYALQTIFQ